MPHRSAADRLLDSGLGRWVAAAAPRAATAPELTVCELAEGETLCNLAKEIDHRMVVWVEPAAEAEVEAGRARAAVAAAQRRLSAVLEAAVTFYQDVLNTVVLMELPIVPIIVHSPEADEGVAHLRRLLLLLLGCAVRGCNQARHVDLIKELDPQLQYDVKAALEDGMRSQLQLGQDESEGGGIDALHTVQQCLVQALAERDEYAKEVAVLKLSGEQSAAAESGFRQRQAQTTAALLEEELEEQENMINALQEALREARAECTAGAARTRQLEGDLLQLGPLQDELETWRTKFEDRVKTSVPIDMYQEKTDKVGFLEKINRELQDQNQLLEAKNARLKANRESSCTLEAKLVATEAESDMLRDTVAALKGEHIEHIESMQGYRTAATQLEREKFQLEEELREARATAAAVESTGQDYRDLRCELAETKTSLLRAEEDLHETKRLVEKRVEEARSEAVRQLKSRRLPAVPGAPRHSRGSLPVPTATTGSQTDPIAAFPFAAATSTPGTPRGSRMQPHSHSPSPRLASRLGNLIRASGEKVAYCASPPLRLGSGSAGTPLDKIKWDDVVNAPSSPLAKPPFTHSKGPLRQLQTAVAGPQGSGSKTVAATAKGAQSRESRVKLSSKSKSKVSGAESSAWEALNQLNLRMSNVQQHTARLGTHVRHPRDRTESKS